jgi:hypothetical protein
MGNARINTMNSELKESPLIRLVRFDVLTTDMNLAQKHKTLA